MASADDVRAVDAVLAAYRDVVGADYDGYRNHVCRVVALCRAQGDFDADAVEKIRIAACFHDIGIWTAGTLDYLAPSAAAAAAHLAAHGRAAWTAEVGEMIAMHHGLSSRAGSAFALVEPFRRADIADFSLGLFPMGLPRALLRRLRDEFPNRGFHRRLVALGWRWFLRHPLNPLPMFRR